jgi:predicted outer membrane repeat protein
LPELARAAVPMQPVQPHARDTHPRLSSTARLVCPLPSPPCISRRRAQTVEFRAAVTFQGGAGGAPSGYAPGSAVTTFGSNGFSSLTFAAAATFRGNVGVQGGGLYLIFASATFNGPTVFDSNTASHDGGGVYCVFSDLAFNGPTSYANNAARRSGGGLYMDTGCTAAFGSGATAAFTANTAAT